MRQLGSGALNRLFFHGTALGLLVFLLRSPLLLFPGFAQHFLGPAASSCLRLLAFAAGIFYLQLCSNFFSFAFFLFFLRSFFCCLATRLFLTCLLQPCLFCAFGRNPFAFLGLSALAIRPRDGIASGRFRLL